MPHPHFARRQSGFTLIEIAIVLVIIGLLLGGVLKGQELITSARVRNMISQQDGIKAAYFGFLDRYRALPGDFNAATTQISGATQNGDGNGQITGRKRSRFGIICRTPALLMARTFTTRRRARRQRPSIRMADVSSLFTMTFMRTQARRPHAPISRRGCNSRRYPRRDRPQNRRRQCAPRHHAFFRLRGRWHGTHRCQLLRHHHGRLEGWCGRDKLRCRHSVLTL